MRTYNSFNLSMIFTGFKRVGTWWNFKNIISPFYRLYFIKEGRGVIYVNGREYALIPNTLFLIPKFTLHSYQCDDHMDHFYICFFDNLRGSPGVPNPAEMDLIQVAEDLDSILIEKYFKLNPNRSLAMVDPKYYDNNQNLYNAQWDESLLTTLHSVTSDGILLYLFSRFLTVESLDKNLSVNSNGKIDQSLQYITTHINKPISIQELADQACLTADHFSRTFKSIVGITPSLYIQRMRIERAQVLLVTSDKNIMEIAELVGILNPSQFTTLFRRIANCSPSEYRERQFKI